VNPSYLITCVEAVHHLFAYESCLKLPTSCAPTMAAHLLNIGFVGKVCCPWWLLDVVYDDCPTIIPLNSGRNGQTNPIYQFPPGRAPVRRRGNLEMREKRHAAMMHAGGLQPEDTHMHQEMRTTYMHGADVAAGGFQPENEPDIQSDGGLQPERGLQPRVAHSPRIRSRSRKKMVVPNCSVKMVARGFMVGQVGDHFFLVAEVECENFGVRGYMNIWHGYGDGEGLGTLYCALEYQPQFRFNCLCGGCRAGWFEQGWVCPLLEFASQGWVVDVGSDDSSEEYYGIDGRRWPSSDSSWGEQ
jgi:hypothetical protein